MIINKRKYLLSKYIKLLNKSNNYILRKKMSLKDSLQRFLRREQLESEIEQVESELAKYNDGNMFIDDQGGPDNTDEELSKLSKEYEEMAVSLLTKYFIDFKDKTLRKDAESSIKIMLSYESTKDLIGKTITDIILEQKYFDNPEELIQVLEAKYSN